MDSIFKPGRVQQSTRPQSSTNFPCQLFYVHSTESRCCNAVMPTRPNDPQIRSPAEPPGGVSALSTESRSSPARRSFETRGASGPLHRSVESSSPLTLSLVPYYNPGQCGPANAGLKSLQIVWCFRERAELQKLTHLRPAMCGNRC